MKSLVTTSKALACIALCMGSVPALANPACALSIQGCVLPVQDVVAAPMATPVYTAGPIVEGTPKAGFLIPLLALAAVAAGLYVLLNDDDDEVVSP